MKYIREYGLWESSGLSRLADLGLTPDLSFVDWLIELMTKDGEFSMQTTYRANNSIYLIHEPTGMLVSITLSRHRGGEPKGLSVIYTTRAHPPVHKQWTDILEPTLTDLEIAELAASTIKRQLANIQESSSDITRLADLGLAPDMAICDWVEELLKGHPDFVVERGVGFAYPTVLIGRRWAKTDIIVKVIDRVLNAEGDTEVTKIALGYIDADGISSSRYSWTPDELRIGPGNLGIARGIVQVLDEYYSRKGVGMQGTVEESADHFDRLLDLGLIDAPLTSPWGLTVARLRHRFPNLKIVADTLGTNLKAYDPDQTETPEIYVEADWNRHQYEGSSLLILTLQRSGQWQPIRRFSQAFVFDTLLRTKGGKKADPQWVSKGFADLIAGYIETWLLKDK
jgi:hypothetical protein